MMIVNDLFGYSSWLSHEWLLMIINHHYPIHYYPIDDYLSPCWPCWLFIPSQNDGIPLPSAAPVPSVLANPWTKWWIFQQATFEDTGGYIPFNIPFVYMIINDYQWFTITNHYFPLNAIKSPLNPIESPLNHPKSPQNHHEITMKSPWNHHEITIFCFFLVRPRRWVRPPIHRLLTSWRGSSQAAGGISWFLKPMKIH
jgi:hypothetical protein